MLQLPQSLLELTGLAAGATTNELFVYLNTDQLNVLDGLIISDESRTAAKTSLESFSKYRLRIEDQVGALQNKFCSVTFGNHLSPILVGIIANDRIEAPPTELENLIFWAIIDTRLQEDQQIGVNFDQQFVDWRECLRGKAIIAEPIDLQLDAANQQAISGLFGLSYPGMPLTVQPDALLFSASSIKLNSQLSNYSEIQALLLHEASSALHPKWRFLSLYRILENAYLTNIKNALLNDFDKDASKAIKSAEKKLSNEPNQLVSLVEGIDAITDFEVFNTEVDTLIGEKNKYIMKLDYAASGEELYKSPDLYKKAVLRFYKIRCSIAHAGTSSVIYEQFPDANSAILRLLPHVETIALKSLDITVI